MMRDSDELDEEMITAEERRNIIILSPIVKLTAGIITFVNRLRRR